MTIKSMELDANDYGQKVAGIKYGKKLTGNQIIIDDAANV